jgi:putative ATP-binding cassette transporter
LLPDFATVAASDLIGNIDRLLNSSALPIAFGILFTGGFIFAAQKPKLEGRSHQWVLLGFILFLLFISVGIKVLNSYALNLITTALNQRNADAFWKSIIILAIIFLIATPIYVLYNYSQKKLGILWRKGLAKNLLELYFRRQSYYQLNHHWVDLSLDNPDQRITQDVASFTHVTLSLLIQLLESVITLFSFTAVLYNISKLLALGLFVYVISGTVLAIVIGNRVIKVNYNQLRLEANFRHSLIRVQANAESIAFYRGEGAEQHHVVYRLLEVVKNFNLLILWDAVINFFQKSYEYIILLFPYFVIAPLYFRNEVEFGEFTQADFAFATMLFALSFIVTRTQQISEYAASINRLGELYEAFDTPDQVYRMLEGTPLAIAHISYEEHRQIELHHLTLKTPDFARTLIQDLSISVPPSGNLLVMGASGVGKSSLLRAIAQLWTSGQGTIARPQLEELLFLPQRPYMIVGTLREQLLYPHLTLSVDDHQLQRILEIVHLPHLVSRFKGGLDAQEDWESILSLGEQQRIAFARILVHRPYYAILDEATSALDVENEQALYKTISQQGITYISVGHRPTLKQYHQRLLTIIEGGQWEVQALNP